VSQGFYFESLERYFQNFDAEKIHVMSFSQLTQSPNLILPELMKFLTSTEFEYQSEDIDYSMPRVNVARTSRFPRLVHRVRASKKFSVEQKNYLSGLTFKKIREVSVLPEDRTYLDEIYSESNSNLKKRLGFNFTF
jgi:hypothetical protein